MAKKKRKLTSKSSSEDRHKHKDYSTKLDYYARLLHNFRRSKYKPNKIVINVDFDVPVEEVAGIVTRNYKNFNIAKEISTSRDLQKRLIDMENAYGYKSPSQVKSKLLG